MKLKKTNLYLSSFIIASSSFTNLIIGEYLIKKVGRNSIFFLIIANIVSLIIFLLLTPLFERLRKTPLNYSTIKNKSTPFYIVVKMVLSIYLVLTLILTIYFSTNQIHAYYFPTLNTLIYFLLILSLITYALKNGYRSLLMFSNFFILIIILFSIFYFSSNMTIDFTHFLPEISFNNDLVLIIMLILPLIFEPFIFLVYLEPTEDRYQKRYLFLFGFISLLFNLFMYLKELTLFDTLLTLIHSPLFESVKMVNLGDYKSNIGIIFLIFYLGLTLIRLLFNLTIFNKIWNLKGTFISLGLLLFALASAFIFLQSFSVFKDIMFHLIVIASYSLVAYAILIIILVLKGGASHV